MMNIRLRYRLIKVFVLIFLVSYSISAWAFLTSAPSERLEGTFFQLAGGLSLHSYTADKKDDGYTGEFSPYSADLSLGYVHAFGNFNFGTQITFLFEGSGYVTGTSQYNNSKRNTVTAYSYNALLRAGYYLPGTPLTINVLAGAGWFNLSKISSTIGIELDATINRYFYLSAMYFFRFGSNLHNDNYYDQHGGYQQQGVTRALKANIFLLGFTYVFLPSSRSDYFLERILAQSTSKKKEINLDDYY